MFLAQSFAPSLLLRIAVLPGPGVWNEGCRRTGRRRAPGLRAHSRTGPALPMRLAPASSPSRLRTARRSLVAWASAPGRHGERSGSQVAGHSPALLS